MSSYQRWLALQQESRRLEKDGPCVYTVVRYCGWDKDDYLFAFLDRDEAEAKCGEINGVPYDRDDPEDFRVSTIPLVTASGTQLPPSSTVSR